MFGIDLSEGGIAKSRERKCGTFKVASVYDDFGAIFPATKFDAVISVEVIEHLYDPRTFTRRIYDALGPGGLAIITTPYWGWLKNVLLAVTGRMDRALTALWTGGHIKHWSYTTLRKLFEEREFEFVAFQGAGRLPFICGMIMVFRKKRF